MPETAATNVWSAWVSGPRESEAPQTINAWAAWAAAEQRRAEEAERRRQQEEERRRRADEQRAQDAEDRRRRQAEAEERRKKAEEERKAAQKRAEELLLSVLSPEQQKDYKANKCFYVEANGEMFRINEGFAGNVEKVDPETKRIIESYCIHPNMYQGGGHLPNEDAMAAQKLALETDPESFKRTANITRH